MGQHHIIQRLDPRRSLRARFALVLGATGLLMALVAGLLVERMERRHQETSLGQAAQLKAQLLARMLDQAVQQRVLQLRQLAQQPLLASGLVEPGDQRQMLEQLRASQPEFIWLGLLDTQGQVEVATNAFLQGQTLAHRAAWQQGRRGSFVGQRHSAGDLERQLARDRDGNPPQLLDLAVPVIDFNGRPLGVLMAELDWNWLQQVLQLLQDPAQPEQVLALDRSGRVVLAWPPEAVGTVVPPAPALAKAPTGAVLTWPDGRSYLSAQASAAGTGAAGQGLDLTLLVRQDTDSVFASAQRMRQRMLQGGLVAALGILLLAAALANAVVRPLRQLADVARRLRQGEAVQFPATADRAGDEVQQLATVLRELDADVRQRMHERAQAHEALQVNLQALDEARAALQRLNGELEERVQARTAQLLAANAELDSFAYAVSHDLRAPLRAMTGFSQALLEDHGPQLDEQARSFLQQIINASHRMGALIDGLLSLSRSTRGAMQLDTVDLGQLAQRAFDELQMAEPQRRATLVLQGNLQVRGDGRMLDAVMRNLIGNAWKYSARLPEAEVQVVERIEDGQRWFCVRDHGAGFDMAHAKRLFQAFSRLHRADEFPGLGIGLATVQRIVHRHGGQIRAEAQVNQGACICFRLAPTPLPEDPAR